VLARWTCGSPPSTTVTGQRPRRCCTLGGKHLDVNDHFPAFLAAEKGGIWAKAEKVPGIGSLNVGGHSNVEAVSCRRILACAACDLVVMDCQYYSDMPERPVSLSPNSLRLVGHVGQVTLDRIRDGSVACLADFDQHVAAVRAELTVACGLPSEASAVGAGQTADRRYTRASRAPKASRASRSQRAAAVPTPPTGIDVSCPDVPFASSALYAAPVLPRVLLLHYACGFVQAAVASGWRPSVTRLGSDWESMRLAAICNLVAEAEAAAELHPDLRALS
jgi:Family of unknown function (DUF6401)